MCVLLLLFMFILCSKLAVGDLKYSFMVRLFLGAFQFRINQRCVLVYICSVCALVAIAVPSDNVLEAACWMACCVFLSVWAALNVGSMWRTSRAWVRCAAHVVTCQCLVA
jgi:hypothetical protein